MKYHTLIPDRFILSLTQEWDKWGILLDNIERYRI